MCAVRVCVIVERPGNHFCQTFIKKTCLCYFDPVKPHLYIEKTGVYRGIHYFFLFLLQSIDFGYSLEPPQRGDSNEYPQSMF